MVHPNNFPRFVPIAELQRVERERDALKAENAKLMRRIAELENRPLIALAPDERVQELEAELAELKRTIPARPVNGRYPCTHCAKTFFSAEVLTGHQERVHGVYAQEGGVANEVGLRD